VIVADPVAASSRVRGRIPEPGRFWIRHTPRLWPAADGWWVDLAEARLRSAGTPGPRRLPDLAGVDLDDVLYLPPVPERLRGERLELIASLVADGTPVLAQCLRGEAAPPGATAVYDLLRDLVEGSLDALAELPPGSCAVWPLIAGVTDAPESWERGCALLAAARVAVVQPLVLELDPQARRQLADSAAHADYARLFHGLPPSERAFSVLAHRAGLQPFLERPLPVRVAAPGQTGAIGMPPVANRRAAGQLALAGELWLRLGRDEAVGQEVLGAARRLGQLPHDVAALAREGNLGLLNWLSTRARAVVEASVAGSKPSLVAELLEDYLRTEPAR
jgi:hypothetical protein